MNDKQDFRMVLRDGTVKAVTVRPSTNPLNPFLADSDDAERPEFGSSPHNAAAGLAWVHDWDVTEIRGPGDPTSAESVAAALAHERAHRLAVECAERDVSSVGNGAVSERGGDSG